MTQFQLGEKETAQRLLEKVGPSIDERSAGNEGQAEDALLGWQQKLELKLLRREAETLILSKQGK